MKLKKYPKRPKASASVQVKENYLKRVQDIDAENRKRVSEDKRSKDLSKRISGLGSASHIMSKRAVSSKPRKKRSGGKKKKK